MIKLAKKLTRKQKKVIKKLFTPTTCFFIILFLIIGAAGAYIYQTKIVKRETGETNIMLTGDLIADVNIGFFVSDLAFKLCPGTIFISVHCCILIRIEQS